MSDDLEAASPYDGMTRSQLIALLKTREMQRKLGLVWERDEIDADRAVDHNFVVADLLEGQSERPAPWENLVIEGDNYDTLRWLRMTHRGRIKCIYVDPPYNTGNKDWVYNDDYVDTNHRFRNSQWLEFLHRRFELARDLLAPDGVLLCSINDTNRAILELMMDQALPGMKAGSLTWRTRTGSNAELPYFMCPVHEHILVYANSDFNFGGTAKSFAMYKYNDQDGKGDWRKSDLTFGYAVGSAGAGTLWYPLLNPKTGIYYPCNPNRVWVYASKDYIKAGTKVKSRLMEEFIEDDQILFPEAGEYRVFETREALLDAIDQKDVPTSGRVPLLTRDLPGFKKANGEEIDFIDFWVGKKIGWGTPAFKRYKKDLRSQTQPLSSWITPNSEKDTVPDETNTIVSGTNDEGAKIIKSVFGSKAFNYAKPVSLIRELISQSTGPQDIVLDFFAGSATTAQAVMELNAEDGLGRRFIMASSTEATEEEPDVNICRDVTSERIRLLNANDDQYEELSAGFAYLKCREINPLELDDELTPASAWTTLEQHHGLPATVWKDSDTFAVHEQDLTALVLIDRWGKDAKAAVNALLARGLGLHIYAYSPGQIDGFEKSDNLEVHGVVETLRRLYSA